jgi:CDP-6-deoxy-D-xylo-4-hexulose-3-dehydrase
MKGDKLEQDLRNEILELTKRYYKQTFGNKLVFSPGDRIAYSGRVFDEREIVNLVDSSLEFWLTSGRYAKRFENELADYLGVKFCLAVNSGSSANLLAFYTLTSYLLGEQRIRPGDEVITVAAGFPTTVSPIVQYGAVPVFVDITLPSYNIDIEMLEAALSPKSKAVFLAHTLGNPFDLVSIKRFCDKNKLWLIEDNCDSLGTMLKINGEWKFTGGIGDIGTSSFYPPHQITMGEGGAVYTNNKLLNRIALSLRDWGRDCQCPSGVDDLCGKRYDGQYGQLPKGYDHKFVYSHMGFNLKVTDMQAAVGCAQLEKLPDFIKVRQKNWEYLRKALDDLSDIFILPEPEADSSPCWFGFIVTVKENSPVTRNQIVQHLEKNNIQTRMLFAGNLLKHPCFVNDDVKYRVVGELTNTDRVMNNAFWFGVYPGLDTDMLGHIVKSIRAIVGR